MQTTAKEHMTVTSLENARSSFMSTFFQRYSRQWMSVVLCLSDLFGFFAAAACGIALRAVMSGKLDAPEYYFWLTPTVLLFLGVYSFRGLYPATGLGAVEELRKVTESTVAVFFLITAMTFWAHSAEYYSRLTIAFAWAFALPFVPLARRISRAIFVRLGLWGEPVAVIGHGRQGQSIVDFLNKNLQFGFRPVVVMDGRDTSGEISLQVPEPPSDSLESSSNTIALAGISTAFLIASELPEPLQKSIIEQQCFNFRRIILIPDLQWIGTVGINPYDFQGVLGLEVRQNLLSPWQQYLKRFIDIFIVLIGGALISPVLLLIALLLKLDSPGGVFYSQERVGRGGRRFKMWKFRTMVQNAEAILEDFLIKNPDMREEWETTQKLKEDPRITRVGKVLRRLSLDELPQLYNILKGEMSLVGPRPFLTSQQEKYGPAYKLYARVTPGITGLWQVSGRNQTTFSERAQWDEYYVRQWSIWMDIYILFHTIWVVLCRDGAY